tara:strand:+ start:5759 stop:5977 length:219 start_codon:yes stop_codon:yes gene_type:complete
MERNTVTNAKRWIFLENLSVFLDRMADDSHSPRSHRGSWLQKEKGMVAVCMGFWDDCCLRRGKGMVVICMGF